MDAGQQPFVTCVMIFLNAEKYFVEAIESVRAQTYPHWELVLVDDGSSDASSGIARDYAARYPDRIRYVEHPGHANRGMSASRNAGVAAGRGDYVAFLDSDDVWLPGWMEHFVAVARRFPQAGMIYGPTLYWYSWRSPDEKPKEFTDKLNMPTDQVIAVPDALRRLLTDARVQPPCVCSLLIRADAYRGVGGFETAFRGLYEDQVFISKITSHYDVVVTDQTFALYRQHDDSCCYQGLKANEYHPEDYHPTRERFLRWLDGYLKAQPAADPLAIEAVRRQLRPYRIPLYARVSNFGRGVRRKLRYARRLLRSHGAAQPVRRIWLTFKGSVLRRKALPPPGISPANPPG